MGLSYRRYRFPPPIIQHAIWLYLRFALSYRNVEERLAERGLEVSYETMRRWVLKFGPGFARRLRRSRPRPSDRWHLDEMVVRIAGKRMYLWRAADHEGEVLDILVQRRRDTRAALRLMRKLLKKQGFAPKLVDPASGLLVFAFHSTVIRTPRATILVDTCSGNDKERPHKLRYHRKNWPYLANLAAAGFMPEDIDYVLCTHLHADHVGWNTRLVGGRWVPTFPNARYLFARREWENWREAELRAAYTTDPNYEDSLLPVMDSGQAELVATDYAFDDSV